jgi:2-desacetyl-2-hydroxyethyl bacteriochlorophyllide A dehydrogenase
MRGIGIIFVDGRAELEEIDLRSPGPGELLVQNTVTHVSAGSEINGLKRSALTKGEPPSGLSARPGYAGVGTVLEVGAGVADFRPGDRVLTMTRHVSHWIVEATSAERAAADDATTYVEKLPDGLSDRRATFAILADVALHGIRLAALQLRESVAVYGLGGVGQLIGQFARLSGAYPVVGVDPDPDRQRAAREHWATHVIGRADGPSDEAVRGLTGGGTQTLFQASANPKMLPEMMRAAANRGKIVIVGAAPLEEVSIGLWAELLHRELRILGSYSLQGNLSSPYWPWTRRLNRRIALDMLATGELQVDYLISHAVPYTQAPEVYGTMQAGPTSWLGVQFLWR